MLFLFLFPLVPAALVIVVIRELSRLKIVANDPIEHEFAIFSILFVIEYMWNLLLCYGIMKMTGAI